MFKILKVWSLFSFLEVILSSYIERKLIHVKELLADIFLVLGQSHVWQTQLGKGRSIFIEILMLRVRKKCLGI